MGKRIRAEQPDEESPFRKGSSFIATSKAPLEDQHPPEARLIETLAEESGSESDISLSEEDQDYRAELKEKITRVNADLLRNVNDVESWFKLVDLQSDLDPSQFLNTGDASLTQSKASERRENSAKGIAEAQIAVLNKAIDSATEVDTLTQLHIARIALAWRRGLWDRKRTEAAWTRLLPASDFWQKIQVKGRIDLWTEYLAWKQENSAAWNMTSMLEAYGNALRHLNEEIMLGPPTAEVEITLLQLQFETANALSRAGYAERAFAIFQAQAQLVFAYDGSYDTFSAFKEVLASMEEKWDAEEPRFGERLPNVASTPAAPSAAVTDPIERWTLMEKARSEARSFPAKATDIPIWDLGEAEIDPFATILFSDISDFICAVRLPESKMAVMASFLQHLGLPQVTRLHGEPHGQLSHLASDEVLNERFWSRTLFPENNHDQSSHQTEGATTRLHNPFLCPVLHFPAGMDTLVPGLSTDNSTHFSLIQRSLINHDRTRLASHLLSSVAAKLPANLNHLALFLAMATSNAPISKIGKNALKGDTSQDASMWLAYACAERRIGKPESARRALHATLPALPCSRCQAARLWTALIGLESETDPASAVNLLCLAARMRLLQPSQEDLRACYDGGAANATAVHRSRVFFKGRAEDLNDDETIRCDAFMCEAYLELLTSPRARTASAIRQLLRNAAAYFSRGAADALQVQTLTWVWHAMKRSKQTFIPPSEARSMFVEASEAGNSIASLSLLAAHEASRRFEGQLRLTLAKQLHRKKTVWPRRLRRDVGREATWVFAIYAETNLYSTHANEQATRRAIESSISELPR